MAELIEKKMLRGVAVPLTKAQAVNGRVYVDFQCLFEKIDELPTTTEADIRAKAYDKAYLKLHRFLVDNMFKFGLTPIEIDWICDGMAEQLKEE